MRVEALGRFMCLGTHTLDLGYQVWCQMPTELSLNFSWAVLVPIFNSST